MNPLIFGYSMLSLAIILEVFATSFLVKSEQFTKVVPSILVAILYAASFYCLSHTLKVVPVGIAYGIWSGVGILLVTLVGYFWFKQAIDIPAAIGLAFIALGVVIINVFSKAI
ncbi:SMR family transporter [Ignatzschineria rhizosphaerae]|uniref:SMR family transporter n=1 Tax=Ignatzschineria rhizosphaerae TaxID=2923279 RepID=A0ABY3WY94_9GAMM|nr:SMR family transporter [Ignatzschineria rhizosphaerae]